MLRRDGCRSKALPGELRFINRGPGGSNALRITSRDCHCRAAYSGIHMSGAKMAKAKKIVRREWTKEDVRQMKAMAKARAGVKKISRTLKRTPGATSVKAAKLGVSLSMRT